MLKYQFLTVINKEDLNESKKDFIYEKELMHSLRSFRYCKAEIFQNCIIGTLRIPEKNDSRNPMIVCGFYLTDKEIYLIEERGNLVSWIEDREEKFQNIKSPEQFLLRFMQLLIEDDLIFLLHIEEEIEKMEDSLSDVSSEDFFSLLSQYRHKLTELDAYYEQLTMIGELLESQDESAIILSPESWKRYALGTERLQNHICLLRENLLQLRELYQSQQDAKLNKTMCILTVVTTIFLPLTLLTGWYGMNFAYMPETHWRYGYPAIIAVAVIIVILEIIYFKKKKLL